MLSVVMGEGDAAPGSQTAEAQRQGGCRVWESVRDSCPGHSQEMQMAKLADKLACPCPRRRRLDGPIKQK